MVVNIGVLVESKDFGVDGAFFLVFFFGGGGGVEDREWTVELWVEKLFGVDRLWNYRKGCKLEKLSSGMDNYFLHLVVHWPTNVKNLVAMLQTQVAQHFQQ